MDEYGCYRNNESDWKEISNSLKKIGSVVFPYSNGNGCCMIILICDRYEQMGIMPFGGKPDGRLYVGIYGRGCNHLSTKQIHPSYIEEKLTKNPEDASIFAEMWNGIMKYYRGENIDT